MKKDDKKPVYVLCPRCELNYINKKDKYCTVCKAEMGILDPSILIPDEEEAGVLKLCPVCRVNYLDDDEEICFLCQKERDEKAVDGEETTLFDGEELPEEAAEEDLDIIPLSVLEEEENEEEEEEEEFEAAKEPDDFDYSVDPSDFEDFDEEEEEAEDDEDF